MPDKHWPLFKLFGIRVQVDASWLILAVLVTWSLAQGLFPHFYPGVEPSTYWSMGFVSKPFTVERLAEAVRTALDSPQTEPQPTD